MGAASSAMGAASGILGKASGILGKAHGVEEGRPSQEDAEVECVGCRQKLPLLAFDAKRMSFWKSSRNVHRDAKCKACGPEPSEEIAAVECVGCLKKLPCHAFDAERLNMWRRNRAITKQAKCNACWAKLPDRRSNAQAQTWKQILYKCSDCNSELPAHKFDTTQLKQ